MSRLKFVSDIVKSEICLGRTYKWNVLIRSVEAQGADRIERQAYVTHKAFSHNCHLCQLFAFCLGVPLSLHAKDCAFILCIKRQFACLLRVGALWVQYK